MSQVYTYRDKVFMYDPQVVQDLDELYHIDVFAKVRQGIDGLLSIGQEFHRVTVTVSQSDNGIEVKVIPV